MVREVTEVTPCVIMERGVSGRMVTRSNSSWLHPYLLQEPSSPLKHVVIPAVAAISMSFVWPTGSILSLIAESPSIPCMVSVPIAMRPLA